MTDGVGRREFITKGSTVAVGTLAAVGLSAAPALAHTTPTRPVVGADLRIYKYPDLSTRIPLDGTGVIDFDAIRIELVLEFAKVVDGVGVNGTPPEHWTIRIEVFGTDPQGSVSRNGTPRMVLLWDTLWHHQNSTGRFNPTEVFQANTYRPLDGAGRIRVQITGDESGFFRDIDVPFTAV